ncbi:hypothetical protein O4H25_14425, partial [Staphylococcus equorum]|nr:hypothetical protein [Staphylococcus equorum]
LVERAGIFVGRELAEERKALERTDRFALGADTIENLLGDGVGRLEDARLSVTPGEGHRDAWEAVTELGEIIEFVGLCLGQSGLENT